MVAIAGAVAVMASISLLFVLIDFETAREILGTVGFGIGWIFAGILAVLIWPIVKFFEGAFWLVDFVAGGLSAAEDPPRYKLHPMTPRRPRKLPTTYCQAGSVT